MLQCEIVNLLALYIVGQINFAGIFAELEQLKAMGGDRMVKTELFPPFGESDIIIYPEEEEEEGLPLYPTQQSSLPAESAQTGHCVCKLHYCYSHFVLGASVSFLPTHAI